MTVEILYPELCNLYGDRGNMEYFKRCVPGQYIETSVESEPFFVSNQVDMVYLGSMSESSCDRILKRLMPHRERLRQMVEQDVVFLLAGNAAELFCQTIQVDGGQPITGLGLVNLTARRILPHRVNSLVLCGFEEQKIVGYTSRFGHLLGIDASTALFSLERGMGSAPDCLYEGYRVRNVFGTYLLGPLLVLNPDFNLYLQRLLSVPSPGLAFEDEVRLAYSLRLAEYEKKETVYPCHLTD
ncbi:MAG: hypothetical protein LUE22_05925 [Oscillospiraceae bacterium]|nr:hypothetical protein [Oscillospiraceae bacterium]